MPAHPAAWMRSPTPGALVCLGKAHAIDVFCGNLRQNSSHCQISCGRIGSASNPMDRTEQPPLLVMPRCGFTGSCLRISVSQRGGRAQSFPRNDVRSRLGLLRACRAGDATDAGDLADWIRWEPGFRADYRQGGHLRRWRPRDRRDREPLPLPPGELRGGVGLARGRRPAHDPRASRAQWVYIGQRGFGRAAPDHDSAFPRILGYEAAPARRRSGTRRSLCRVLMGDLLEIEGWRGSCGRLRCPTGCSSSARERSSRMPTIRTGWTTRTLPGMTFHAGLVRARFWRGQRGRQLATISEIGRLGRRQLLALTTVRPTSRSATFGSRRAGLGQDRSDFQRQHRLGNDPGGHADACHCCLGSRLRRSSARSCPCTSDPLPPLVYYSADQPAAFRRDRHLESNGGGGSVTFRDPESGSLIASLDRHASRLPGVGSRRTSP